MSNYATLKAAIQSAVYTNGNNEITGAGLQAVLLQIVDTVGDGYIFKGVATAGTTPGTPDANVFYIAPAGTYTNFGGSHTVPEGSIGVFTWNGSQYSLTSVKTQDIEVFDISAYNNNAKYADLTDALNGGANIPQNLRKGGIIVKFIQNSDNKYVQYRLMSDTFNTTETNWQGVDDEPTAGSDNLVKSGGVLDFLDSNYTIIKNYLLSSLIESGKRINSKLNWEVVSDKYKYVKTYLPAGKYRIICAPIYNLGYLPSFVKFTDDTYTTAEEAIIQSIDTDQILELNAGYYVLQWNISFNIVPKILLYNKIDNLPTENSKELVLSGGVYSQMKKIENEFSLSNNSVFNSLFSEFYFPLAIQNATYKVFVNVAKLVSGRYYNSLYIYRNGGSAIVVFDENFETEAEALSAFTGVKYRNTKSAYGYIVAKPQSQGLQLNRTTIVFTNPLTLEFAPNISSYLNKYKLTKKKILWEGDSICADNEWDRTGWRTRVESMTGAAGVNKSEGGSVLTDGLYAGETLVSCVYRRLANDMQENSDVDYFIFDGGTNDADRIGRIVQWVDGSDETKVEPTASRPVAFGSWNDTDFSGNYNPNTFCGAVEQIIFNLLSTFKGKKIGYIIAPKMGNSSGLTYFNRKAYFDTVKSICKKWGVPVLDLWEETWLNPNLISQYDSTKTKQQNVNLGNYYLDGQHPAPDGFDYLSPIIADWIESL